jgi:hypothetical protein
VVLVAEVPHSPRNAFPDVRLFELADLMQGESDQLGSQLGFGTEAIDQKISDLFDSRRRRVTSHPNVVSKKDPARNSGVKLRLTGRSGHCRRTTLVG